MSGIPQTLRRYEGVNSDCSGITTDAGQEDWELGMGNHSMDMTVVEGSISSGMYAEVCDGTSGVRLRTYVPGRTN